MDIISGPKTLFRNTLFPAGFVLIGHLSDIEKKLGSFPKNGTAFRESAQDCLSSIWQGCSVANAKALGSSAVEFGSSIGSSVYHLTPIGPIATAATALSDYKVEIGTAAVIGATATVIDAVLKRLPVIKHHPYLRVLTSIGLATGATYYAANALSPFTVDPQMIKDIAIKVLVIGGLAKATTSTTQVAFTVLRGSSEWVSWGFRGICSGVVKTADMLDFGSLPEGAKKVEKVKSQEKTEEIRPVLSAEDIKEFQNWKSSRETTPVKQRTPLKESPIEELQEL